MNLQSLVNFIIELFIIGAICGLLWWLVGFAGKKGLPVLFVSIGQVVIAIVAVLLLINMLLGLTGSGQFLRLR
jgi:hypothetical protein